MKKHLLIDDLLKQLAEFGIDTKSMQTQSCGLIKSELLQYISGGRSERGADGEHKETFLKTPVGSIY